MKELTAEENLLISGGWLASDSGNRPDPFQIPSQWPDSWVVRYDVGGSWIDTGTQCVPLNTAGMGYSGPFQSALNWLSSQAESYVRNNCSVSATISTNSVPGLELSCTLFGK
jgi:hypothetical protein